MDEKMFLKVKALLHNKQCSLKPVKYTKHVINLNTHFNPRLIKYRFQIPPALRVPLRSSTRFLAHVNPSSSPFNEANPPIYNQTK
jgi:hypothetical protein